MVLSMSFIGIDPGKSGGIAVIDDMGVVEQVIKMPGDERGLLHVFGALRGRAVLEKVHAGIFGGGRMGAVSAFTFGYGYGSLKMALVACHVQFEEVTPQKWQKALDCRTGGDKNVSKRKAQELFPQVKVTHHVADALLLAEYCRRLETRA